MAKPWVNKKGQKLCEFDCNCKYPDHCEGYSGGCDMFCDHLATVFFRGRALCSCHADVGLEILKKAEKPEDCFKLIRVSDGKAVDLEDAWDEAIKK